MTYRAVTVFVSDKQVPHDPLANVVVSVYDSAGVNLVTSSVSDVDGEASFLLPDNTTYTLRFYRYATSFVQPQAITVLEEDPNEFDVYGTPFVYPSAVDPRFCKASGYFRTPTGAPAAFVDIHFTTVFSPLLVDGNAMVTPRVHVRTDERGYAEIQLVRFGQYNVVVEGMEDVQRTVHVPDNPWVNLPDLLFPVVTRIVWDGNITEVTVPLGTLVEIGAQAFTSDLRTLDNVSSDVNWSNSETTVLDLRPGVTSVGFFGCKLGTSVVSATRKDTSIIRIPNVPISGVPITVNVV